MSKAQTNSAEQTLRDLLMRKRQATKQPSGVPLISSLVKDYHPQSGSIVPTTLKKYAALIPEIYVGWARPKIDHTTFVAFSPSIQGDTLDDPDSVLLCHCLTPVEDSIFLLAELGRVNRIAAGLGVPVKVMLADDSWSSLNWVVKDYEDIADLTKNYEFRKALYRNMNVDLRSCSTSLTADDLVDPPLPHDDVSRYASEYEHLAEIFFGKDITSKRISDEILSETKASKLLKSLKVQTREGKKNILSLKVFFDPLQPHLELVQKVHSKLRRLDRNTFRYFLLQLFHQARFPRSLKVAVTREKDFDQPFKSFCSQLGKTNYDRQAAIYLRDYSVGRGEGGHELTVHPYYFPSGSFYGNQPRPFEEYAQKAILLSDGGNDEKIASILATMNDFQRARLIADLLSFVHFGGETTADARVEVEECFRIAREGGDRTAESAWRVYSQRFGADFRDAVCTWHEDLWSPLPTQGPMPYHFFPFFWSHLGVTAKQEARTVSGILTSVSRSLG
jgi:hypothetical protein